MISGYLVLIRRKASGKLTTYGYSDDVGGLEVLMSQAKQLTQVKEIVAAQVVDFERVKFNKTISDNHHDNCIG